MTHQEYEESQGSIEFHVYVHDDGDNEIWWSPKSRHWDGMDVVKDTVEELREELVSYGHDDERIDTALQELEEKEAHERVTV